MSRGNQSSIPAAPRTVTSSDGTPISYHTLGAGPGVVLVGGALRTAQDYLPLARELASRCTVHVVDRRGRGASGPQGPDYTLRKEAEDLLAVQADTGARLVFGHSYGGRAALETARRSPVFERIAVYEPGVSTDPVPTGWMAPYRERLAAGDAHGAFVHFLRDSGGAPRIVTRLPRWYLRAVLRVAFRGQSWRRMRPLLEANLVEHEQLAAHAGDLAAFATVTAPVLLLRGSRSASAPGTGDPLDALHHILPSATLETMDGLNHFGPEGKTAPVVARRTLAFLLGNHDDHRSPV